MASTTIMLTIGILVGSFAVGIAFYYVMDSNPKQLKKRRLDEVITIIIQFIIYLWLAKIIMQLPKVFQDPFAILAYPSNSKHFYIANGLLVMYIAYKCWKQKFEKFPLFQTFSFVMIITLFMYEFLQIITNENYHINFYFITVMVLVLLYVLLYHKGSQYKLAVAVSGAWLVLAFILSIKDGYFILFGFMLQPAYFIVLLILLLFIVYRNFKKV